MAETTTTPETNGTFAARNLLAGGIAIFSIIAVSVIGWKALDILKDPENIDKKGQYLQTIITALLPVIGTWMGTVIAFYFSKDNFEAASRSMQSVIKTLTPEQKLNSQPCKEAMRKVSDIILMDNLAATTLLKDITQFLTTKNINRLPEIKDEKILQCIHISIFQKFIAEKSIEASGKNPPEALTPLTYNDLISDTAFYALNLKNAVQTIKPDATLLDAKKLMDKYENCQDVFVTEDGTTAGKVLGWITDSMILENSKV